MDFEKMRISDGVGFEKYLIDPDKIPSFDEVLKLQVGGVGGVPWPKSVSVLESIYNYLRARRFPPAFTSAHLSRGTGIELRFYGLVLEKWLEILGYKRHHNVRRKDSGWPIKLCDFFPKETTTSLYLRTDINVRKDNEAFKFFARWAVTGELYCNKHEERVGISNNLV